MEPYLELPEDFPADVRDLAREKTASAIGPYQQAMALQDFLRNNYTYDEAAPAGHSDDHLRYFLFRSKIGYCEQFAGAFAAMARSHRPARPGRRRLHPRRLRPAARHLPRDDQGGPRLARGPHQRDGLGGLRADAGALRAQPDELHRHLQPGGQPDAGHHDHDHRRRGPGRPDADDGAGRRRRRRTRSSPRRRRRTAGSSGGWARSASASWGWRRCWPYRRS